MCPGNDAAHQKERLVDPARRLQNHARAIGLSCHALRQDRKDGPMEQHDLPPPRRPYPSKLFVEVTTRCNLGCRMCPKQAAGCAIADGDLPPELFERMEPAFPHLDALIL